MQPLFNLSTKEVITVSTSSRPDALGVKVFKERVKKALRRGFKIDGEMKFTADGMLEQDLSKPRK